MIQREKLADQNRLPRFQITPYSAVVGLVGEQSALLPLEEPGREKRFPFANSLPTTTFASRETRTYLIIPECCLLTRFLAQTRQPVHITDPEIHN